MQKTRRISRDRRFRHRWSSWITMRVLRCLRPDLKCRWFASIVLKNKIGVLDVVRYSSSSKWNVLKPVPVGHGSGDDKLSQVCCRLFFKIQFMNLNKQVNRGKKFTFAVWIFKIWDLPFSSGKEISMWTSRRPGRSRASSIISRRLVIPMMRMLFNCSTPSNYSRKISCEHFFFSLLVRGWNLGIYIFFRGAERNKKKQHDFTLASNWFTTESPTPVPSFFDPRCLQMASNSSKMMMWSPLSSPLALYF